MLEIRRINAENKRDIALPNEPFPLFGRLLPRYGGGRWTYDVERFETVTEMCFPDENYDFDAMSKDCFFLGAYDGGDCVGLAVLQKGMFRYLYLYDLKVNRAWRGRGAAAALIAAAGQLALEQGCRGLWTVGQDNNLGACLFYLRSGFRIGGLDTEVYKGTAQEGKADVIFYLDCAVERDRSAAAEGGGTESGFALRPVRPEDCETVRSMFLECNASEFGKYDPIARTEEADVREYLDRMRREHVIWAVTDTGSDEMLGYVCFHVDADAYDLGYMIAERHRGRGAATAAARAAMERLAVERGAVCFTAATAAENLPSVRVLEKLGFSPVSETRIDAAAGPFTERRYRKTLRRKPVRITVLRTASYEDLMERYENPIEHACGMKPGQRFLSVDGARPEGFCDSAWETLAPFVAELARGGGNFYGGWMKNPHSALLSCNDGFRPVSFLLEAVE